MLLGLFLIASYVITELEDVCRLCVAYYVCKRASDIFRWRNSKCFLYLPTYYTTNNLHNIIMCLGYRIIHTIIFSQVFYLVRAFRQKMTTTEKSKINGSFVVNFNDSECFCWWVLHESASLFQVVTFEISNIRLQINKLNGIIFGILTKIIVSFLFFLKKMFHTYLQLINNK